MASSFPAGRCCTEFKVAHLAGALSTFVSSDGTLRIVASSLPGVSMLDMSNLPAVLEKAEVMAMVTP
jgi:hypothetical protein